MAPLLCPLNISILALVACHCAPEPTAAEGGCELTPDNGGLIGISAIRDLIVCHALSKMLPAPAPSYTSSDVTSNTKALRGLFQEGHSCLSFTTASLQNSPSLVPT